MIFNLTFKVLIFLKYHKCLNQNTRILGYITTGLIKRRPFQYNEHNTTLLFNSRRNYVTNCMLSWNRIFRIRHYCKTYASNCWKCNVETIYVNNLFCQHCNSLRRPQECESLFDVLGIKKQYGVDPIELSNKYKQLQKYLHPDKFGNKPLEEQALSSEWSALVNQAYSTLSHGLKRAEYLLGLYHITIPEESETKDYDFLMEMMEKNEEVEALSTPEDSLKMLRAVRRELHTMGELIEKSIIANDMDEALRVLRKMKYFDSLEQSIKGKASKLGAVE